MKFNLNHNILHNAKAKVTYRTYQNNIFVFKRNIFYVISI